MQQYEYKKIISELKKTINELNAIMKEVQSAMEYASRPKKVELQGLCYECQFWNRKDEIGENQKAYNLELRGNTVAMGMCTQCNEEKGLLPERDMNNAIKASNNEYVSDWD